VQKRRFEIKKGIPLPPRTHGGHGKGIPTMYPFPDMEVGDCFDAPRDMGMWRNHDKRQNSISSAASGWISRNSPRAAFTTRLLDDGVTVRCWRIA
jgi:hypothetical protein